MNREAICAALFTKVSAAASFSYASRRFKHWQDVPLADQPALFLSQTQEVVTQSPGYPPVSTLFYDVHLYARTASPDAVPGQILNPLIDAVVATLMAPDNVMTNKLTLGGLAQHCWIEGFIKIDEGVLGDQGVCIIPVAIKVA
jgi:hypothetical protein